MALNNFYSWLDIKREEEEHRHTCPVCGDERWCGATFCRMVRKKACWGCELKGRPVPGVGR